MCLALPARIVALGDDDRATVDLGGVRKTISIELTPGVRVGDHVIVHVGHAIGTLDADEAARTLALFAEMTAMQVALDAQVDGDALARVDAADLAAPADTATGGPPPARPGAGPAGGGR